MSRTSMAELSRNTKTVFSGRVFQELLLLPWRWSRASAFLGCGGFDHLESAEFIPYCIIAWQQKCQGEQESHKHQKSLLE